MEAYPWIEHAARLVQEFRKSLAEDFVTRREHNEDMNMVAQLITDVQTAVAKLKADVAAKLDIIAGNTLDPATATALQGVVNDLTSLDNEVLNAGATGTGAPAAPANA